MHFNKQQQHHDFTQTSDNTTTSLSSNDSARQITSTHASVIEKFTGSAGSCTSSTDSGVNISDNETAATAPPSPSPQLQLQPQSQQQQQQQPQPPPTTLNPFSEQFHKNNSNRTSFVDNKTNNNSSRRNSGDWEEGAHAGKSCTTFDNKLKSEEQQLKNGSKENNYNASYQSNRNAIQIENVIKSSHPATTDEEVAATTAGERAAASLRHNGFNDLTRASSPASSSIVSSSDTSEDPPSHHRCSRSPAVSIRSIGSSIIDSDSDSDVNGGLEGVHENYVIKKLGTQVSYPPKHPDIPTINEGLRVVNHQITPNGMGPNGMPPPSPLAVLTNLGDTLGMTHSSFGQAPCVSSRPQVAISSSTDVTIGDKHFYEGPVTIQQFLIDSRDKWNESNGKDNVTFVHDKNGDTRNYAKDLNSSPAASSKPYVKLLKRKKFMIPGVLVVTALVVLALVLVMETPNDNKNTNASNVDDTEADECIEGKLCFIERDIWRAHPQKQKLDPHELLPLHRVIIAHTASEPCDSIATCRDRVRVIQEYHMNSYKWDDIGYNFLISSDGRVYIGRGWDDIGATVKGYNRDSVGIAFIGTYMSTKPTEAQLNACRLLLEEGVRLNKLVPNYILNGARQLTGTESPGDALYKIIRKWPHWTAQIII